MMRRSFMPVAAALFAASACPAIAAQWDVTNDKGLLIHRLKAEDLRVTVVCDPEGAFSPPQNYLFVEQNGQRVETGTLNVSGGDRTVTLPIEGAAVLPSENVEGWNASMKLLFGGGAVTLALGQASVAVNVERMNDSCTASG